MRPDLLLGRRGERLDEVPCSMPRVPGTARHGGWYRSTGTRLWAQEVARKRSRPSPGGKPYQDSLYRLHRFRRWLNPRDSITSTKGSVFAATPPSPAGTWPSSLGGYGTQGGSYERLMIMFSV